MASDRKFVDFVCEQMSDAGRISARAMFGEFALYCDGKVVALVCDNRLFVKKTAAGESLLDEAVEGPPYPGARAHFVIEDGLDDREGLSRLIAATAAALPSPKPKKKRSGKKR